MLTESVALFPHRLDCVNLLDNTPRPEHEAKHSNVVALRFYLLNIGLKPQALRQALSVELVMNKDATWRMKKHSLSAGNFSEWLANLRPMPIWRVALATAVIEVLHIHLSTEAEKAGIPKDAFFWKRQRMADEWWQHLNKDEDLRPWLSEFRASIYDRLEKDQTRSVTDALVFQNYSLSMKSRMTSKEHAK